MGGVFQFIRRFAHVSALLSLLSTAAIAQGFRSDTVDRFSMALDLCMIAIRTSDMSLLEAFPQTMADTGVNVRVRVVPAEGATPAIVRSCSITTREPQSATTRLDLVRWSETMMADLIESHDPIVEPNPLSIRPPALLWCENETLPIRITIGAMQRGADVAVNIFSNAFAPNPCEEE